MKVYLVRHAHAGERTAHHHDLYRPLSDRGWTRARSLVDLLLPLSPSRILASPATRCVQTMEPLAQATGTEVEEHPDLWEGSAPAHVLALLRHQGETVVACSHGDVIPSVIEYLAADGVPVSGRGCEKGSIWILEHDGHQWSQARYRQADDNRPLQV